MDLTASLARCVTFGNAFTAGGPRDLICCGIVYRVGMTYLEEMRISGDNAYKMPATTSPLHTVHAESRPVQLSDSL